jgi:MtN3 and saliva related transmembrane protein
MVPVAVIRVMSRRPTGTLFKIRRLRRLISQSRRGIPLGDLAAYIGGGAAFLASLSYIPQVRKAWPRGSTDDLSLGMLAALTLGLVLWIAYGLLRHDWVIAAANTVGAALSGTVLGCKIRDL